jgi:hypothetical protein
MSGPWCYLLGRYGDETGAPTREAISEAVKQLYEESLPDMTEGDYDAHGAASLRFGYDDGPMYVLEITRHGVARWEEWADQDYQTALCPVKERESLPYEKAVLLSEQLAEGKADLVRAYFQTA